jgi:ribulose kinase
MVRRAVHWLLRTADANRVGDAGRYRVIDADSSASEHEPHAASTADKFMDMHGFLVQRLTGTVLTSLASADSFGLTDIARAAWVEDLITAIGLHPERSATPSRLARSSAR